MSGSVLAGDAAVEGHYVVPASVWEANGVLAEDVRYRMMVLLEKEMCSPRLVESGDGWLRGAWDKVRLYCAYFAWSDAPPGMLRDDTPYYFAELFCSPDVEFGVQKSEAVK